MSGPDIKETVREKYGDAAFARAGGREERLLRR